MNDLNQSIGFVRNTLKPYIKDVDDYVAADNQQSYYEIFKKKKVRGGYRYIYRCTDPKILNAQKLLYEKLRDYQSEVLSCSHGFIKNRSTVTNAKRHTEKPYLLHIDIKDFFDSISVKQVEDAFLRLGMQPEVAHMLSRLATVDGVTRQGLHTSPDISNHCLYQMDLSLMDLCAKNDISYSRYGDDMTFSAITPPDINNIRPIIEGAGFRINEKKLKLQKRGSNQYVTGLTVFDGSPRIPRSFKKRLRLQLYYIDQMGFEEHVKWVRNVNRDDFSSDEEYDYYFTGMLYGTANHIIGQVSYVHSVEPQLAVGMWKILNDNTVRDYGKDSQA